MRTPLFRIGDRVRFADLVSGHILERYRGEIIELNTPRTIRPHARRSYKVRWNASEVMSVEEFEIEPADGWDVPDSRRPADIERWLAS